MIAAKSKEINKQIKQLIYIMKCCGIDLSFKLHINVCEHVSSFVSLIFYSTFIFIYRKKADTVIII